MACPESSQPTRYVLRCDCTSASTGADPRLPDRTEATIGGDGAAGGVAFTGSRGSFAGETGAAGARATRASAEGVGVGVRAGAATVAGVTAVGDADPIAGADGLAADSVRLGAGGAFVGALAIARPATGACSARGDAGCAAE